MVTPEQRLNPNSAQFLLRNVTVYVIYLAVALRAEGSMYADPAFLRITLLLVAFGGLLVASNWLEHRSQRLHAAYLLVQSALIVGFFPQRFNQDYFPILFVPLSLQAVLFFGRRQGFAWIGAFSILTVGAVLVSWQGQPASLITGLLFAGGCFFTGNYAFMVRKAEAARQHNQELVNQLALTNQKLQEYATRAELHATLNERNRMARELHDSATQTIFSLNLAVQAAQLLACKDPSRMVDQLERVQELAHSAVGEIQVLSSQLRQSMPAEENLAAALRRLASERQARDGMEIYLEIDGGRELEDAVAAGLFRITQEALNNISKHAGTRQAAIYLHLDHQPACLEIRDQGYGFNPADIASGRLEGHHGLHGMAERAGEIQWTFTLDSRPGHGTLIRVEEANQ